MTSAGIDAGTDAARRVLYRCNRAGPGRLSPVTVPYPVAITLRIICIGSQRFRGHGRHEFAPRDCATVRRANDAECADWVAARRVASTGHAGRGRSVRPWLGAALLVEACGDL